MQKPSHKPTAPSYKSFDSDFCGSIPLNFINLVQPHGMLLVLDQRDLQVVQASENAAEIVGLAADEIVGQPLAAFLEEGQLSFIQEQLEKKELAKRVPLYINWQSPENNRDLSGMLYIKDAYLLLELEPLSGNGRTDSFIQIYQEISRVVALLKEAENVAEVCTKAARALKKLSGFDKVMIYQFDEAWNGEVVGEAKEADMPTYLGLHFPASDVPRQAREQYFTNPYRLIPNAQAQGVKMYPVINPLTSSLTDIAESSLRGVPLVHLEYLKNMGVQASMSTPIIIGNQLWGLISCHHSSARKISFDLRSSFEIISGVFSAQLNALAKQASFLYRAELHKIEIRLFEQMYSKPTLEEGLLQDPSFLKELLKVQGLVLVTSYSYETAGTVPDKFFVQSLLKWLSRYNREKVFYTDSLPRVFSTAEKYKDISSGLIAIEMSIGKSYLLGFRQELIKSVNWGGNPHEAIQLDQDGTHYHPRYSFKRWQEQVENTSADWKKEEIEAAENVRTAILEKLIKAAEGSGGLT